MPGFEPLSLRLLRVTYSAGTSRDARHKEDGARCPLPEALLETWSIEKDVGSTEVLNMFGEDSDLWNVAWEIIYNHIRDLWTLPTSKG